MNAAIFSRHPGDSLYNLALAAFIFNIAALGVFAVFDMPRLAAMTGIAVVIFACACIVLDAYRDRMRALQEIDEVHRAIGNLTGEQA